MSYNITTEKFDGYIYKICNSINKKIYIGKTTKTLTHRFNQHCSKTAHKEDNSILHKAMEKYGVNNFYIEEIEMISPISEDELNFQLNKKEKYYIKLFNTITPNGYNILAGGENTPKNRIKSICMFDMQGNFIKEHKSITNALEYVGEVNLKSTKIQYHLSTDSCAYGYLWSYNRQDNPLISYNKWHNNNPNKLNKIRKHPSISQYDHNKKFIRYFKTASQAGRELFDDKVNLYAYASGIKNHFYGNYYWYFSNDNNQPDTTKIIEHVS